MPSNGVYRTVISTVDPKGKTSESVITTALSDANNAAKKADPKKDKKK